MSNLKQRLNNDETIMLPGAYDALSARCIEQVGFDAMGTTGFGIHGSLLGIPDNGEVSFSEMLMVCSHIANAVSIPVICDAEAGYGNAASTYRTVQEFERAGIAGVLIEDQRLPANCPFYKTTELVSIEEMCGKVRAAVAARKDPNFLIIARSDAHGEEAIDRYEAYKEAGADGFKPTPMSRAELEFYAKRVTLPMHFGVMPGKEISAGMSVKDLGELGYRMVSFPMVALFSSTKAIIDALRVVKTTEFDDNNLDKYIKIGDYFDIVRAPFFRELDEKYVKR